MASSVPTSVPTLLSLEGWVRDRISKYRWTHKDISNFLILKYPGARGFSIRSIERFCSVQGIHKTLKNSDADLDRIVTSSVRTVGPTYGRKMMCGLLAAKGIYVSEGRVGQSLRRIAPSNHQARSSNSARRLNPVPYQASYFGHKLHIDQNEKLCMYGVTHVCATDGYSRKIVGFFTMPVKNNLVIYEKLYCPIIKDYGMWDQLRIDKGKEWYLTLFIQEELAHLRTNTRRAPHVQTSSKLNHMAERIWVEINSRVNYPLKFCLRDMEDLGDINMDDPIHKFCVSWITIHVANIGVKLVINSWNNHRIPNKGIPDVLMMRNKKTSVISSSVVPSTQNAVQRYRALGGTLTDPHTFGCDPLEGQLHLLQMRNNLFLSKYQFKVMFYTTVNGDNSYFKEGLKFFIEITKRLSH